MAVRRVVALLGAVFMLWAFIFAWVVRRASTVEPSSAAALTEQGAVLFARHCASCHAVDDMRAAVSVDLDGTHRAALERFLDDHGDASAEEDRQILDYLAGSSNVEK